MRAWRWPVRLLIPAALVAGLVFDDRLDRADDGSDVIDEVQLELSVSPAAALSTTWHCPAVHLRRVAELGVDATAEIVVHNTANRPTRARVELLSATSAPRVVEFEVPGLSVRRTAVEPAETDELVAASSESADSTLCIHSPVTHL